MTISKYDVAVVGSGPSGLFAVDTLLRANPNIKIIVFEKGNEVGKRVCPAIEGECANCNVCNMVSGAGGAGLFSDGKLVLDLNSGGHLDIIESNQYNKKKLVNYIENLLLKFDGKSVKYKSLSKEEYIKYSDFLKQYGLNFKYYQVRHIGSYNLKNIINNFITHLKQNKNIYFMFNTEVENIFPFNNNFLINYEKNKYIKAKKVIVAAGKVGSDWVEKTLSSIGCKFEDNQFYFGVRVESRKEAISDLFKFSLDPKFSRVYEDGSKIKVHCACREGKIAILNYNSNALVGGHTIFTSKNNNVGEVPHSSNFNVLMSINPNKYLNPEKILNRFKKHSNNKLFVQLLGDFIDNKKSDSYGVVKPTNERILTFGNIRELTEDIHFFPDKFLNFISRLNKIVPGIVDRDNLLYAPAIEWWMSKIIVDQKMQTSVPGLFAVGDGAGLSQGIVHSAATGIIAAKQILKEYNEEIHINDEIEERLLYERYTNCC
ncbi:MAG: NAD(P)/FAD-dependent oxidoreductase [Bacillota bacterium]